MSITVPFLLIVTAAVLEPSEAKPITNEEVKEYLEKYGYINGYTSNKVVISGNGENNPVIRKAIERFQTMAGLQATGKLDDKTLKKMQQPRCGVPDVLHVSADPVKWSKTNITYAVTQYTNDISADIVNQAIKDSFAIWEAVSPLKFKLDTTNPDVTIGFFTGSHGDGAPFDGKGGVLAHALLPYAGIAPYLHFDDAESWTYKDTNKILHENYIDMLYVGVHEIGHVLGLEHTNAPNSIMNPYYRSSTDENGNYVIPELGSDDIRRIQEIYNSDDLNLPNQSNKDPSCVDLLPQCSLVISQCTTSVLLQTFCKRTCNFCG